MTNLVVALILIISIITDIRSRKILNIVTLPAILLAFVYHFFISGLEGLLFSVLGFLVGFGLLIIPFVMGGIGAGDVKLLAAVGAWTGVLFVLYTGLYGAIIGGLISLFILIRKKHTKITIQNMFASAAILKGKDGSLQLNNKISYSIPYAIPIALGALFTFLMGELL